MTVEFDPATGLPTRETYTEPRSEWRSSGNGGYFFGTGAQLRVTRYLPFKAIQLENGMKILEVTVSEYKINSGLTAAELSKRP